MARRSWPIAANPVTGALTWGGSLAQTLLAVSVPNTGAGNVTWTGGASSDQWPVSVDVATGVLGFSGGSSALATDSFTRADAASLGTTETGSLAWSTVSAGGGTATGNIASNTAYVTNSAGGTDSHALVDCGTANHDVTITVSTMQNFASILVRFIDASNYVMVQKESTAGYGMYRRVAGTFTLMGSTSTVAPASGDVLRLVASGTTYTFYQNGTQRITATDATANTTGTKVGFRTTSTGVTARFDDFSVSAA